MKVKKEVETIYRDILSKYPMVCAEEGDLAKECEPFKLKKKKILGFKKRREDSYVDFSDIA